MSDQPGASNAASQTNAESAKPVIPVSKNPRHKRRRIQLWDPRKPRPNLITSKLFEFLQHPRSDFSKDSRFLQNKHLTAADFCAIRLIASAMAGDVQAFRELVDRTEGRVPLALPGSAGAANDPKNIVIQVIYEDPSPQVQQRQKEINERNARQEAERAKKTLPAGDIEYIDAK
ncbi:MAG: hypothetical protein WA197_18475 [Candidatus Acidiferrales bacterium]